MIDSSEYSNYARLKRESLSLYPKLILFLFKRLPDLRIFQKHSVDEGKVEMQTSHGSNNAMTTTACQHNEILTQCGKDEAAEENNVVYYWYYPRMVCMIV